MRMRVMEGKMRSLLPRGSWLFLCMTLCAIWGCAPPYVSVQGPDAVPVELVAKRLRQRSGIYMDEWVDVFMVEDPSDKLTARIKLSFSEPQKNISLKPDEPVHLRFIQNIPLVGVLVTGRGDKTFIPKRDRRYYFEFCFDFDLDTLKPGVAYLWFREFDAYGVLTHEEFQPLRFILKRF